MFCSLSHTIDEIKAGVQKLIDGDTIRKEVIIELAEQFNSAHVAKDDPKKAYAEYKDIAQEN